MKKQILIKKEKLNNSSKLESWISEKLNKYKNVAISENKYEFYGKELGISSLIGYPVKSRVVELDEKGKEKIVIVYKD